MFQEEPFLQARWQCAEDFHYRLGVWYLSCKLGARPHSLKLVCGFSLRPLPTSACRPTYPKYVSGGMRESCGEDYPRNLFFLLFLPSLPISRLSVPSFLSFFVCIACPRSMNGENEITAMEACITHTPSPSHCFVALKKKEKREKRKERIQELFLI